MNCVNGADGSKDDLAGPSDALIIAWNGLDGPFPRAFSPERDSARAGSVASPF